MALSSHDELILLRKRARRRLVGAVVLVSVATAVLWKVVDHLPEQQMRPESIEIMGGASAPASAKKAASPVVAEAMPPAGSATELPANLSSITAPAPAAHEASRPAEKTQEKPAASSKPEPKPIPKSEPKHTPEAPKPESKPRKQPDPAAILEGRFDSESHPAKSEARGKSIIQLAALSDPAKVEAMRGKLASIGVSAHFSKVETSKGEVTRVRVGPFASQAEAQAALHKLARAGINGIIINK